MRLSRVVFALFTAFASQAYANCIIHTDGKQYCDGNVAQTPQVPQINCVRPTYPVWGGAEWICEYPVQRYTPAPTYYSPPVHYTAPYYGYPGYGYYGYGTGFYFGFNLGHGHGGGGHRGRH